MLDIYYYFISVFFIFLSFNTLYIYYVLFINNFLTFSTVTYTFTHYITIWGNIFDIYFFRHYTFNKPTSSLTAKLCLFKLLILTVSKSIIRILFTPDLASMFTTWEPTPPTPNTITKEFYNLLNFY